MLFFDNLSFFTDEQPPLTFKPRPKRNLQPFPGQSHAANTGPGTLPFPTREETILPDSAKPGAKNSVSAENDRSFVLRYQGPDGVLSYRYMPHSGTPAALHRAMAEQRAPQHPQRWRRAVSRRRRAPRSSTREQRAHQLRH
jgi:hypothetical protein